MGQRKNCWIGWRWWNLSLSGGGCGYNFLDMKDRGVGKDESEKRA